MRYNQKERIGVIQVDLIFTKETGWIFREQPIVDVGIDALIEKSVVGNPKGNFLAAQIKSGLGNFYETIEFLTYYVSKVHYYYWLNLDLPIILIAHIEKDGYTCWENICRENLTKSKKQWKINIPKSKLLSVESKTELEELISNNRTEEIFLNKFLNGNIPREEIHKILTCSELITKSKETIYRMIDIMTETSKGLNENTAKINIYIKNGINYKSKKGRELINNISKIINKSANSLETETEEFAKYFSEGFISFEKLSSIYFQISKDSEGLEQTYQIMLKIELSINDAIEGFMLLKHKVELLPENIPKLKKAKYNFVETSENIIKEYLAARKLSRRLSNFLYEKAL